MARRSKSTSGFIYLWYDCKHKRFYLGSHWGTLNDGYVCSSYWMKNAINKRPDDFRRRIISYVYTTREDLYEEEFRWLQLIKPSELKVRYYNITRAKYNGKANTLPIKQKIGNSIKAKYQTDIKWSAARKTHMSAVGKAKLSSSYFEPGHEPWNKNGEGLQVAWNKGKSGGQIPWTGKERPDVQQRMLKTNPNATGDSMRGKHHREESKRKSSDSNRGQKRSDSTKAALQAHHAGRKWWTNGVTVKRQKECPGEGWVSGKKLTINM